MGKTADLAMIQKTVIDALHKEGKSQRGITERWAVHRVLYQSIFNAKLTGRKNLGRKSCKSNRDDLKLENTVKQSDSNTWDSFIRSGLKLESVHQESPRSDIFRKRATKPRLNQRQRQKHLIDSYRNILPGLWRKRTGLLLSGPKSSFQMKVNFAFNLEIKVPESGEWRGTEPMLLEVQCEVSTVSHDLGCHVICWCSSTVFSGKLPSADKLYGDADLILAPAHTTKDNKSWFNDHGVTVLDWSANSPDLNPIENLDERHQTQQCR